MAKGRIFLGCKISREFSFEIKIKGNIKIDHISKMIDMLKTQQYLLTNKEKLEPEYALEQFLEKKEIETEIDVDSLAKLYSIKNEEKKAMDGVWQSMVISAENAVNRSSRQIPSASTHMVLYIDGKLKYLNKRNKDLLKKMINK